VEVKFHAFLISAVDGEQWSASRPDSFTSGDGDQCALGKRPGGTQSRSGSGGEKKNP
jgi:hypothetical protein